MEITRQMIRSWSRMGSSAAFGEAALACAKEDSSIMLLTADLPSFSAWMHAANEVSEQYRNVGIAEQNLIGLACGMAKEGLTVFAASYAPFSTGRCFDQVRTGMGYMGLPVKLMGMAAGFSIGVLGATHMCLDDIALMHSIPGITIICPADSLEAVKAAEALAQYDKPAYIRLTGGLPNPPVHKDDYEYRIGKAEKIVEGTDVCLIASGSMVHESTMAAKSLAEAGISASVVNMHTIRPLDKESILRAIESNVSLLVTAEEHYYDCGLGSIVQEYLHELGNPLPLLKIGVEKGYFHAAPYGDLIREAGLKASQITERIKLALSTL